VSVSGIADKPEDRTLIFSGIEDENYPIGDAITSELTNIASFEGILVDADGSETLTFEISGVGTLDRIVLPEGLEDSISPLGGGAYQITPEGMMALQLKPMPHYSGASNVTENWYSDVKIRAITQESDTGRVAYSDFWPVVFEIAPVVTSDGIGNLAPTYITNEAFNEVDGNGIFFFDMEVAADKDLDGSEYVVDYTINITAILDDAAILDRLVELEGAGANAQTIIDNYLIAGDGAFVDNGNGTITVDAGRFGSAGAGLRFNGTLFLDSSINFKIPFTVRVQDKAVLFDGKDYIVETTQSGFYNVKIMGVADVPSVNVTSSSGSSGELVPVFFNGTFTDRDISLGRNQSESIYFILAEQSIDGNFSDYAIVNAAGAIVGFGAGGDRKFLNTLMQTTRAS
jgi:hypothetical protein